MNEPLLTPLPSPLSPVPPSAPHWLDLDSASRLSGLSERHLRRLCAEKWMSEDKALPPQSGVRTNWQVRSDAHPAFTTPAQLIPAASLTLDDLRTVPRKLLDRANDKLRIIKEWQAAVAAGATLKLSVNAATDRFLDCLPKTEKGERPIERATLFNWQRLFRAEGLAGLLDGRGKKAQRVFQNKTADSFLAEVKRLYLDQRQRGLVLCYDMALDKARDLGWKVSGRSTARRFIERLDPKEVIFRREGPKAFTDKVESFLEGDFSPLHANEWWNTDDHIFDVLVKVGERLNLETGEAEPILMRPFLSAIQDLRSRKILSWCIRSTSPNTDSFLAILKEACETHGVPENMLTDNGKNFDAKVFTGITKKERIKLWKAKKLSINYDQKKLGGIFAALGINHHLAKKFHGQSKPIERFFGTLCGRFSKQYDTYTGRNPQEKPEDLVDHIKAGRFPTLEQFTADFGQWLEVDYQHKNHGGDAVKGVEGGPAAAWQASLQTKRTAPAEVLALLLQPRIGPLRVGQNGLTYNSLGFGKYDLREFFDQQVYIRVGTDLSQVSVWTPDDRPLAIAHTNERLPKNATPEQLRRAMNEKRSDSRAIKAAWEPQLRIAESLPDRMFRKSLPGNAGLPTGTPPPSFSPIRSDLEAHLNTLQELQDSNLKLAAGAESMSLEALESAFGVNND